MKKIALMCLALCMVGATALAEAQAPAAEEPPVAMEQQEVATPENIAAKLPKDKQVEIITTEEMQERLHADNAEDLVYFKLAEDTVVVYENLAGDKATCQEILYASPKEYIIDVYSNNKAAYNQFWKAVKAHKGEWDNVAGYKAAGAKSPAQKLSKKTAIYKLWFQKVKTDSRRVKTGGRGFGLPIGIGINIPIGGHHRPSIGIGF